MAKENVKRAEAEDLEDDDPNLKPGPTEDGGMNVDLAQLRREAGEDDERPTKRGGEHRERIEDRGGLDDADAEREAEERRARRREERKERKADAERREDERDQELQQMREELGRVNAQLSARQGESVRDTVGRIDERMETLRSQYETARSLKGKAFEQAKDNPQEAARASSDADEAMAVAREEFNRLGNMRERVIYDAEQEQRRPKFNPVELKRHADGFVKQYEWFDPKGGDKDSRIVLRLDRELGAEGKLKPDSSAYWRELGKRVEEELPSRFEDDPDPDRGERGGRREEREQRPQRRAHVGGGSRETAGGGGTGVFHLSRDRIQAMKDAGMWDDAKARASMIKRYQQEDRNKTAQQRK